MPQPRIIATRQLTSDSSLKSNLQTSDHIGYLTWSRDRSSVYFDTNTTAQPSYYKLRISDAKLERVMDLKPYRFFPGQFGGAPWTSLAPKFTGHAHYLRVRRHLRASPWRCCLPQILLSQEL